MAIRNQFSVNEIETSYQKILYVIHVKTVEHAPGFDIKCYPGQFLLRYQLENSLVNRINKMGTTCKKITCELHQMWLEHASFEQKMFSCVKFWKVDIENDISMVWVGEI